MFVLEALLLTFMTTPAVVLLYPPEMRVRVSPTGANFGHVDGADKGTQSMIEAASNATAERRDKPAIDLWKKRFTVVLDKIEHLPGMLALTQLLQPPPAALSKEITSPASDVSVEALRLIELSDRTSAVMMSSTWNSLIYTDPLLGVFRTFGEVNGMDVSTSLAIVSYDDLASSVSEVADRNGAQLVLLPWLPPHHNASTDNNADAGAETPRVQTTNPFENMFRTGGKSSHHSASALHSHFVRSVFAQSNTDVALFVDRHIPGEVPKVTSGASGTGGRYHLFVPFFGGPDDRLALEFALQLCAHPRVSATMVRFTREEDEALRYTSIDKPDMAHVREDINMGQNALTVASVSLLP